MVGWQADLRIAYVSSEGYAGWRNPSKSGLL